MRAKMTIEEFINKAQSIHGNKYDYSNTEYIGFNKPLTIICKEHGPFNQKPKHHLTGSGCKLCFNKEKSKKMTLSKDTFIERCKKEFPEYDYSETEYEEMDKKITIICKKHGKFTKLARKFILEHQGCPMCSKEK